MSQAETSGLGISSVHAIVISPGIPLNIGGVISITVITCSSVAILSQSSVTLHLLTMVPQPSSTELLTAESTTVSEESQLSVAVTIGTSGILSQVTNMSSGTPNNTGEEISCKEIN